MSIKYNFDKKLLKILNDGATDPKACMLSMRESRTLAKAIAYEACDAYKRPIIIAGCKIAIELIERASVKLDGEERAKELNKLTESLVELFFLDIDGKDEGK